MVLGKTNYAKEQYPIRFSSCCLFCHSSITIKQTNEQKQIEFTDTQMPTQTLPNRCAWFVGVFCSRAHFLLAFHGCDLYAKVENLPYIPLIYFIRAEFTRVAFFRMRK